MRTEINNDQDIVKNVFEILTQIASDMDKRPDRNGCVVVKIDLEGKKMESSTYGLLTFDDDGYQFARFLRNATEKATRVFHQEIASSRDNRNEMNLQFAGGINLNVINLDYFFTAFPCNVYACSGFMEKYDEAISLIGGLFEDLYNSKPDRTVDYYLAEVERVISEVFGRMDEKAVEDLNVVLEMFRLLERKLKKQKVPI